eukprot:SAG22_NODE_3429_length_1717_cov_1.699629_2_plen_245_part_00
MRCCTTHNGQMDASNARFSDVADGLDLKLVEKLAAQEGRLREQNSHFAEVCSGLEAKFEDAAKAQQAHFGETVAAMDHKLVEWTKDIDARGDEMGATINENHRHFTAVCAKLDAQLGSECEALKADAGKGRADGKEALEKLRKEARAGLAAHEAAHESLAAAVADQDGRFGDGLARLDDLLAHTAAGLEEAVGQERQERQELLAALDRKVAEQHDAAAARVRQRSCLFTAFPCVSLPFLAVPLL